MFPTNASWPCPKVVYFKIDYEDWTIRFYKDDEDEYIKISRGEEAIFVWCIFMAICELAIDEADAYKWVKYIYIDDPISSLDDNNDKGKKDNTKNKPSYPFLFESEGTSLLSSSIASMIDIIFSLFSSSKAKSLMRCSISNWLTP